ncbi:MAG: type III pantothenate kinase [Alphaproteobacteria bacterium]|nr:type III pantothenate kinase [Alphaproteobacteria bacterium]
MLLAIDIGNTNTVFALYDEDELTESWRCKTESARSADEYAVFLNQLFDLSSTNWTDIQDIIVSSVVPDVTFHIEKFCRKYLDCAPLFVDANCTNLIIDLDMPGEIGADRIVNAVAVTAHYQTPAIVIDFGTATTFDVIDTGGIYRGGVIAPGVRLSLEALSRRAAKLPLIGIQKPSRLIGKNTTDAMQSGMYWGYIGLIEGIIEKIEQEMGQDAFVIATGGLAPLYAQSTDVIHAVDEHLILKGLLQIYKDNKNT